MGAILDEISQDQGTAVSRCTLCAWLETQPEADQAEWDAALATKSFTRASIFRALKRHGVVIGKETAANHTKSDHRVSK